MSYFPVIIKTAHLKEIRAMVEEHMKMPFNLAFQKFSGTWQTTGVAIGYCQFNIMCTYLYRFRKDEYTWYMHDTR